MRNLTSGLLTLLCAIALVRAEVDWESRTIDVVGVTAATVQKELMDELFALPYGLGRNVAEHARDDVHLQENLDKYVQDYARISQQYLTDGSIQYHGSMAINGKLLALLLPQAAPVRLIVPMLCPCCGQDWPAGKAVPEGIVLQPKLDAPSDHTGIIVDCRGHAFQPSLFPRVYDESGSLVYSADFCDASTLLENAVCAYTTSTAELSSRVGDKPLTIKAVGTARDDATGITITTADAREIHGSRHNLDLLKECRVVIIYSP